MPAETVLLDGNSLTLADLVKVARGGAEVQLSPPAKQRMAKSAAWVGLAAAGKLVDEEGESLPVYGVNTGYGSLARVRVGLDKIRELSWNLIRSHAAGVGPPVCEEAVRAMMLLRANALSKGASGCRPELVECLTSMLGARVHPVVPSRGSCGSSGDLAPLAHLGLVVFRGEDPAETTWATHNGERMRGDEAMAAAGIDRLVPGPKEGLAMTNGAQLTAAITALTLYDAARLVKVAEIAAAMSWEALRGVTRALHPEVHALRPFPGARASAANLLALMEGSALTDSLPDKVQDAYSLRCSPIVVGAVRDALTYGAAQVGIELNAVTDNPVILLDVEHPNKAFSAGLFHGEPVGFAADHAKLALCELGSLSERRVYRLTTGKLSSRLPPLLAGRDGPELGLMMPQTTAAALVATNRQMAWPSSVDTLPTCEDQEDHVAMSTTAARRASDVLANVRKIVGIELLAAAEGLLARRTEEPGVVLGVGTAIALDVVQAARVEGGLPADDLAVLGSREMQEALLDAVSAQVSLASVPGAGE